MHSIFLPAHAAGAMTPSDGRRDGNARRIFKPEQLAGAEIEAERLAECNGGCQSNVNGRCRECCAGTPVTTLVKLTASRCWLKKWTR